LRRVHCLTVAFAVAAFSGGVAAGDVRAQETPGQSRGLRYLSWNGRTEAPAPAREGAPLAPRTDLRRPNRVIPHGGSAAESPPAASPAPAQGGGRRTLTPANAWMRPAAALPEPAPAPSAPSPAPELPVVAPATPDYLPDMGGRGQAIPAEVLGQSAPASVVAPPNDDPMAPRRDAPIFRLQQPPAPAQEVSAPIGRQAGGEPVDARAASPQPRRIASVAANPDDRPSQQGARYYSVHRQNGREPDALTMPQPTYVDALAVTITETPASQDLAQPDQGPTLIRDANGRVRAQPAAPGGGDYE
jgi:hypothetical protein